VNTNEMNMARILRQKDAEIERLTKDNARLRGMADEFRALMVKVERLDELVADNEWLQEQNTLLAERIGCGCGGDFGICNECTAALTGKRA
jgi:hypothetical protein